MAQLDGKQLKDLSVSLGKLNQSGLVTFNTGATMSFGSGAVLRTETANINAANDVVNKEYVDAIASGLDAKTPVKTVAATGSIILSGVGFQIDSYTVSAFDRILVAAQAGPNIATSSNGIYIATSSSWYRADDADGNPSNEVSHGNYVFVTEGNLYEHSGWVLTITDASNPNNILVGTDSQGWVQFSEATQLNAGEGLYSVGREINVGAGTGITVSTNSVSIADTTVTSGNYGTAGSVSTFTVNAQGQLVGATSVSIDINSGQINDFNTSVESVVFTDSNFVDGVTITFSVTTGSDVTAEVQLGSLTPSRFDIINSASASQGWQLGYNNSGQFEWIDPTLVGDITEVVAGNGLTGGGNTGTVTLSTDILVNGGLTYSGNSLEVYVDNDTITIVDGKLQGAAQGILGVTAGNGLSGGGTGPNYITLDVNLGTNSGLVFSGDDIIISDTIAGSGLTFSVGVINVNTANGLTINSDNVEVADTIAGSGLTFSAGVINVNTANGLTINSDNVEVADTISGQGLTFSNGVIDMVWGGTSSGLTFSNDAVVVVVDGTTIAINGSGQLSVISGSAKPVYQSGTASTIGDNQATLTFSSTPNDYSRIEVFVNGQRQRLGDGVTTNDCYISSTSSIAENLENVVSGQTLYWNGTIAGFDLSATDVIELIYES